MKFKGMQKIILIALATVTLMATSWSVNAQLAGTWQHPLDGWTVDGYKFGEFVMYLNKYHLADDAFATAGTPVFATANGTVKALHNFSGYQNYGGLVLIEHQNVDGSLVVSLYGHLDPYSFTVAEDQDVQRGQLIGYIGTEDVNGGWPEHIHYGVRNGSYVASPWVYWGYGDGAALAQWSDPTAYIAAHNDVIEVERVPTASRDRYETAVGVSQRRFAASSSAKTVLLASGATHADALAAAPLVKSDAVLLLTKTNELPMTTENEIKRVLPAGGSIVILGGEKTIGAAVTNRLTTLGFSVSTIAGANRETTATLIAEKLGNLTTAFVVNKSAFADAVSVSGVAATTATPVLLTNSNTLSAATRDFLTKTASITKVVIVGGSTALSTQVEQELKAIPHVSQVVRLEGRDRYATNVAVNQAYVTNVKDIILATGLDYPDALSGGGLAGNSQGALLLTKNSELPGPTQSYAASQRNSVERGLILGGSAAIDLDMDLLLASLLNAPITTAGMPDSGVSGASAGTTDAASVNGTIFSLSGAKLESASSITVPVPAGFVQREVTHRDATIVSVFDPKATGDVADTVVVTRIAKEDGASMEEKLREWFGTDISVTAHGEFGLALLAPLPGFSATTTAVLERGDDYLVFETRLPQDLALEILEHLAENNKLTQQ